MFASHRGTTILPITSDTPFRPVFWVASLNPNPIPTYHVKLANYGPVPQPMTITIPGTTKGGIVSFSGPERKENIYGQTMIKPMMMDVEGGEGGVYMFDMPAWSVMVLSVT